DLFWSKTCLGHNGFFGSSLSPYKTSPVTKCGMFYPSIKHLHENIIKKLSTDTWFRLITKHLEVGKKTSEYKWVEVAFFSHWDKETNLLICFDLPKAQIELFKSALDSTDAVSLGLYSLQTILLKLLVPLYDTSILDLSKRVREIEKNRDRMSGTDFPGLHNTARHTAHATETVNVASDVFSRMATQCEALAARQEQNSSEAEAMYERFETLKFLHSIMIGIGARSASNEKRLSNEINLVFNMMAQKDNDVNIDIAKATRTDSAAMKAIAVVSLTFLPSTYVSALLGMNLFSFDPDTHGGHMTVSPDLKYYLLASVLLTAAVLAAWWLWQLCDGWNEKKKDESEEVVKMGSLASN
ncbi:hypothetical protein D6D02_06993, partial [Aureobasidium pullulans]